MILHLHGMIEIEWNHLKKSYSCLPQRLLVLQSIEVFNFYVTCKESHSFREKNTNRTKNGSMAINFTQFHAVKPTREKTPSIKIKRIAIEILCYISRLTALIAYGNIKTAHKNPSVHQGASWKRLVFYRHTFFP